MEINLYNGITNNVDLETQGMDFVGTHTLLLYEDLNNKEVTSIVYPKEEVRDIETIALSGKTTCIFLRDKEFSVQNIEED